MQFMEKRHMTKTTVCRKFYCTCLNLTVGIKPNFNVKKIMNKIYLICYLISVLYAKSAIITFPIEIYVYCHFTILFKLNVALLWYN